MSYLPEWNVQFRGIFSVTVMTLSPRGRLDFLFFRASSLLWSRALPPSPEMLPFLFPLTVGDFGVPQDSAIGVPQPPVWHMYHLGVALGMMKGEIPVREGKDLIETTPCSLKS